MEKPMYLPLEVVLNVITCSLPSNLDTILPASHPTTKLLLSFSLVCQETRRLAQRYLRKHCFYIDKARRLSSILLQIPKRPELRNVDSLYLSPFGATLDDQPTAFWSRELLLYTYKVLKRLVITFPFKTLYLEHDHLNIRRILYEGLANLETIEEFVSVQDELGLHDNLYLGLPLWAHWPNLRRLALCGICPNPAFWHDIAQVPALENVVLTEPDYRPVPNWNWFHPGFNYDWAVESPSPLKIVVIKESAILRISEAEEESWIKLNRPITIEYLTWVETSMEAVKSAALSGTLWNWSGKVMMRDSRKLGVFGAAIPQWPN